VRTSDLTILLLFHISITLVSGRFFPVIQWLQDDTDH
jgi:hypothetical protein